MLQTLILLAEHIEDTYSDLCVRDAFRTSTIPGAQRILKIYVDEGPEHAVWSLRNTSGCLPIIEIYLNMHDTLVFKGIRVRSGGYHVANNAALPALGDPEFFATLDSFISEVLHTWKGRFKIISTRPS